MLNQQWTDNAAGEIASRPAAGRAHRSARRTSTVPRGALKYDTSVMWTVFWSAIAALVPILRLASVEGVWLTPLRYFKYIIFMALIASALLNLMKRPAGHYIWLTAPVLIGIAGYLSSGSSSVLVNVSAAAQLAILCALAPAVFRYHIEYTRGFVPAILGAFVTTQTLSAAAGLIQLTGTSVLDQATLFGRSTGFAGHPNVLGLMCVIGMLVTISLFEGARRSLKPVLLASLTINSFALVATGSLSAMLAGVIGIGLYAIGRRRLIFAIVCCIAALTVGSLAELRDTWFAKFVENRFMSVTGESVSAGDASLEIRLRTYEWALDHITKDPFFGVGISNQNAGTFDGVTAVHNYMLHVWYQGGLLFLLWIVAMSIVLAIAVAGALRSRRAVGTSAVIGAIIAFASTSAFFTQQQYWIPLLFAVAMLPTADAPNELKGRTAEDHVESESQASRSRKQTT